MAIPLIVPYCCHVDEPNFRIGFGTRLTELFPKSIWKFQLHIYDAVLYLYVYIYVYFHILHIAHSMRQYKDLPVGDDLGEKLQVEQYSTNQLIA